MRQKYEQQMKKGVLEMLVLQLLSEKEKYGYQLICELKERSREIFLLKEGTLYPILHGLEAERLVTVREKEADGRVRKYYRITKKGRRTLEEKKAAWKYFAEQVDAVVNSASLA